MNDTFEAGINAAVAKLKDRLNHAWEREYYFTKGDGWRTHCAGAIGAEEAAKYFKREANILSNMIEVVEELADHDMPYSGSIERE